MFLGIFQHISRMHLFVQAQLFHFLKIVTSVVVSSGRISFLLMEIEWNFYLALVTLITNVRCLLQGPFVCVKICIFIHSYMWTTFFLRCLNLIIFVCLLWYVYHICICIVNLSCRRTTSVTSESGDEKESLPLAKHITMQTSEDAMNRRKSKKSLFRSKITKVWRSLIML